MSCSSSVRTIAAHNYENSVQCNTFVLILFNSFSHNVCKPRSTYYNVINIKVEPALGFHNKICTKQDSNVKVVSLTCFKQRRMECKQILPGILALSCCSKTCPILYPLAQPQVRVSIQSTPAVAILLCFHHNA